MQSLNLIYFFDIKRTLEANERVANGPMTEDWLTNQIDMC